MTTCCFLGANLKLEGRLRSWSGFGGDFTLPMAYRKYITNKNKQNGYIQCIEVDYVHILSVSRSIVAWDAVFLSANAGAATIIMPLAEALAAGSPQVALQSMKTVWCHGSRCCLRCTSIISQYLPSSYLPVRGAFCPFFSIMFMLTYWWCMVFRSGTTSWWPDGHFGSFWQNQNYWQVESITKVDTEEDMLRTLEMTYTLADLTVNDGWDGNHEKMLGVKYRIYHASYDFIIFYMYIRKDVSCYDFKRWFWDIWGINPEHFSNPEGAMLPSGNLP